MFWIGQKVVCINDGDIEGLPGATGLWYDDEAIHKGRIYTISGVLPDPVYPDRIIVTLFEVKRRTNCYSIAAYLGYAIERFRPLVEKKTDISIFTELLNSVNHKNLEPA
jgi:hypothetical protein